LVRPIKLALTENLRLSAKVWHRMWVQAQCRSGFFGWVTLLTAKSDIVSERGTLPKRVHAEASATIGLDSELGDAHPLSHRLRAATTDLHHQAEKLLNIPSLIIDRSSYAATLKRFYGVYAPLERALGEHCGWDKFGLDLKGRSHVARIARDLAALGSETSPGEAPYSSEPTSFSHALGSLYVMEGSTLGGRIILRHLETQEISIPTGAMSFFAGHGVETGSMWRVFVAKLDVFGELNPASCHAVQEGAQRTFQEIIGWFEPFCSQMRHRL
jgi:heme oxygenase